MVNHVFVSFSEVQIYDLYIFTCVEILTKLVQENSYSMKIFFLSLIIKAYFTPWKYKNAIKNYKIENHTLVDRIRHQLQCRFVLVAKEGELFSRIIRH